jgi:hypothetical protein
MMGFPNTKVFYQRMERTAGESKYPLRKMLHLAMDGITSFSNRPLKWISMIGLIIFIISLILSVWVLWVVVTGRSVPGWALTLYLFYWRYQLLSLSIGNMFQDIPGI